MQRSRGMGRMDEQVVWDDPSHQESDSDNDADSDETVGGIWGDWSAPSVQAAPAVDAVERFKDRLKRGARERQGRPSGETT